MRFFVTKPLNLDEVEMLLKRALRSRNLETENKQLTQQVAKSHKLDRLIGKSLEIQKVSELIQQVAPTRATILIEGESGTGKEVVASLLHHLSGRPAAKMVTVHCAALSPQLLESELFGHEKGAFTGASAGRAGLVEAADGGTLFLDEIGDMPLTLQSKLLRVLQEKEYEPVGSNQMLRSDVRIIAATSIDLQADTDYLDRFLLEEWIARRIRSPHVLRPSASVRKREFLYVAMEYVQGQTLAQWMIDHPRPELPVVRDIVGQIARGLQAFHRMEMLHQDLRPENIMIDSEGTVKIIDFGAVHVAGLAENAPPGAASDILGTVQYTAPEYFLGEAGTPRSDLFSLGVITYQMLTGRLPYGTQVASLRTRAALVRLRYASALNAQRPIPAWIDAVLERAVHPHPLKRQEALSEFVHDLRQPGAASLARHRTPLAERNPLMFWRSLSLVLALAVVALLGVVHSLR